MYMMGSTCTYTYICINPNTTYLWSSLGTSSIHPSSVSVRKNFFLLICHPSSMYIPSSRIGTQLLMSRHSCCHTRIPRYYHSPSSSIGIAYIVCIGRKMSMVCVCVTLRRACMTRNIRRYEMVRVFVEPFLGSRN